MSNIYNIGGYGGYYKSEKDRYKEQLAGAKRLEQRIKYDIFRSSKRFDSSWKNLDQMANQEDQGLDDERLHLPEDFLKKPVLHQKNMSMFNDQARRKKGTLSPKRRM